MGLNLEWPKLWCSRIPLPMTGVHKSVKRPYCGTRRLAVASLVRFRTAMNAPGQRRSPRNSSNPGRSI